MNEVNNYKHAWFSQIQFEHRSETKYDSGSDSKHDLPYIYYQITDNNNKRKIVQITEINSSRKSYFQDAIYLGRVVKFIRAYKEPQDIEKITI
jgi:hypothetical protein